MPQRNFVELEKSAKNYAFLLTESNTLATDILVPNQVREGGKTEIKLWSKDKPNGPKKQKKNPFGEVIDILGKAGENTTENACHSC